MRTFIFLWLQNQTFYKNLQQKAVEPIGSTQTQKYWADIGCSTGLITRLASTLNYDVTGYDINDFSLRVAKLLSWNKKNVKYLNQDFYDIETKFETISATSLLSVVDDKEAALKKLISLLNDNNSTLIIIEPTKNLTLENVWKQIDTLKDFWFYKGLLLWAKAREYKHIEEELFVTPKNIDINHTYHLHNMVRITYIKLK